jgi:hypothetical protein
VDLGSSLDAEEQTAMHDALHYVLTTVARPPMKGAIGEYSRMNCSRSF